MAKKKTVIIDDSIKKEEVSKEETVVETKVEESVSEATKAPAAKKEKKERSKKYKTARALVDQKKLYSPKEAIALAKKTSLTSFDGNLEAHLGTTITGDLGQLSLPHAKGMKEKKVVLVTPALLEEIKKGQINFDILIATPQDMKNLVPLARTLGPKGLMPNPKNGTLTDKPKETLKKLSSGGTKIKTEKKSPVAHLVIGKISQTGKQLEENLSTLVKTIKLQNIKKITLSATMGPGIKVDLSDFS